MNQNSPRSPTANCPPQVRGAGGSFSKFILASASPRRVELLRKVITNFDVIPADVDESVLPNEKPIELTRRLAISKACKSFLPGSTTLGADTIVTIDGEILGKPQDKDEAREMLFRLSGKTHEVVTAWCLKTDAQEIIGHDIAKVTFRLLAFAEIESYLAANDPTQFAGGYAIQGAGRNFIENVEGDFETVVGLPTNQIAKQLVK